MPREVRLIVRWLIEGTRGGRLRARILLLLRDGPMNAHQLARSLGVNYRTATHHLRVLQEHGLVERLGDGYGSPYVLTSLAEEAWPVIEESIRKVLGGGK